MSALILNACDVKVGLI